MMHKQRVSSQNKNNTANKFYQEKLTTAFFLFFFFVVVIFSLKLEKVDLFFICNDCKSLTNLQIVFIFKGLVNDKLIFVPFTS